MHRSIVPSRRYLEQAIEDGRFTFITEPIVEIGTGKLFAEESLIRLRHEEGTLIYPRNFISTLENDDLIAQMDCMVFKRLLEHPRRANDPTLCINLSARTLGCPAASEKIYQLIATSSLSPARLIVEITETATVGDMDYAAYFLGRLKALGVRTAIDDFGTGNASWRYLKFLPVDIIKIDGQFVRDIVNNREDWRLLRAMSNMASTLNKIVIAEWVETRETYNYLLSTGIRYAQGFFVQEMQGLPQEAAHG